MLTTMHFAMRSVRGNPKLRVPSVSVQHTGGQASVYTAHRWTSAQQPRPQSPQPIHNERDQLRVADGLQRYACPIEYEALAILQKNVARIASE
jgi:hypothetical protein